MPIQTPDEILTLWFGDVPEDRSAMWFMSDAQLDETCRERFADTLLAAAHAELDAWHNSPPEALAWIILTDQLSRNIHRATAEAFALDAAAVKLTKRCIELGFDTNMHLFERAFLYMPLEHSEAIADQDECVCQFERLARDTPAGLEERARAFVEYAEQHRELIRRFGRFPHRNAVLERKSTSEEVAHMEGDAERFGQ